MLIPVVYAVLNVGDEVLERPELEAHGRLVADGPVGKQPRKDGILHLGQPQVLAPRYVEPGLELQVLVAVSVNFAGPRL